MTTDSTATLESERAGEAGAGSRGGLGEWNRLAGTKDEIEALGTLFEKSTAVARKEEGRKRRSVGWRMRNLRIVDGERQSFSRVCSPKNG